MRILPKRIFKSLAGLLFLILLSNLLSSCVYYRTQLETEYRKQADQAYANKNYTLALEYYQKTNKFIALNNNSQYRVAEIEIRLKNYDKARKKINRLMFRDPRNVLVKELDAYWYFATGDFETAIEKYQKILDKKPFDERVLVNLGIIYYEQKDFETAVDYFNQALEGETLTPEVLNKYVIALSSLTPESENLDVVEDRKQTLLLGAVNDYLTAYQRGDVSIGEILQIGEIISSQYAEYTYPLYKTIADTPSKQEEDKKFIALANFIMAESIFTQVYQPLDVDTTVLAFERLEKSLELGYAQNDGAELNRAQRLFNVVTTSVQVRKLLNLYNDYGVIGKTEYYQRLLELEQSEQSGTKQ